MTQQMALKKAQARPGRKALCIAMTAALLAPGCAVDPKTGKPSFKETFASDDPCSNNARNIGIALGTVAGAGLGYKLGKGSDGALAGAAAGALLGGLIGHSMDARRCEIARLSTQYGMTVEIAPITAGEATPSVVAAGAVASSAPEPSAGTASTASFSNASGMTISVRDNNEQFASNSARLEPKAAEYFSKVAAQYSYEQQSALLAKNNRLSKEEKEDVESLKKRRILLVGHTDDTGSSARNAELSEERAKTVGEVFRAAGVPDSQIFYQGAGETLPVADNRTPEGRIRNRRVEIVDLSDEAVFANYLAARRPKLAYYRPTDGIAQKPAPETAHAADKPISPEPLSKQALRQKSATVVAQRPSKPGKTNPPEPASSMTGPSADRDAKPASALFDFGGTPAVTGHRGVNVGELVREKEVFSLISTAYAAGADVPPSCADDRPRESRGVKSLRDQKDISFTELMPGLYGSTWSDTVHGNLVAVTNIAIYRDGAQPATRPTVLVYRDFKGNRDAKADARLQGEANTYRGNKALLYRVFLDGPVKCMDVVLSYSGAQQALDSQLLYPRNEKLYVAGFKPSIAAR